MSTKITAHDVAIELRKLADAFDRSPESEIEPLLIKSFHLQESHKQAFLNLVKLLPRPLVKDQSGLEMKITWGTIWRSPVALEASIPKSLTCELVEPAKPAVYRCHPLLSEDEETVLPEVQA